MIFSAERVALCSVSSSTSLQFAYHAMMQYVKVVAKVQERWTGGVVGKFSGGVGRVSWSAIIGVEGVKQTAENLQIMSTTHYMRM